MPQSWMKRVVFFSYVPVGVLAGLGIGWQYLPRLTPLGDCISQLNSSDGKFRASVWHQTGCGAQFLPCDSSKGTTAIVLERKFGLFSLGAANIFLANAEAADVQIRWTTPATLFVSCKRCASDGYIESANAWRAVAIKYDEGLN